MKRYPQKKWKELENKITGIFYNYKIVWQKENDNLNQLFKKIKQSKIVISVVGLGCHIAMLFNKKIIPKLLSRSIISGFAFDTELIVSAYKQNLKIKEVAIEWIHDYASKVSILKQVYYMGKDIIKIKMNS